MEAFVYCWTDYKRNKKLKKKLYIGWHLGSQDDGYVCSSKVMLKEYKERPKDFTRQIVATGTKDDMRNFEVSLLKAAGAATDEHYYNMTSGPYPDRTGMTHTLETKAKMGRPMSGELNPMWGKKRPDARQIAIDGAHKISAWAKDPKNKKPCYVCGRKMHPGNLAQHRRSNKCQPID